MPYIDGQFVVGSFVTSKTGKTTFTEAGTGKKTVVREAPPPAKPPAKLAEMKPPEPKPIFKDRVATPEEELAVKILREEPGAQEAIITPAPKPKPKPKAIEIAAPEKEPTARQQRQHFFLCR